MNLEQKIRKQKYYEEHIKQQKNKDYLEGYIQGLQKRKDISHSEKNEYILLAKQRINYLTKKEWLNKWENYFKNK